MVWYDGRPRCLLCGEPVELDDPLDIESWAHAEDTNDLADHTAEIERASIGFRPPPDAPTEVI